MFFFLILLRRNLLFYKKNSISLKSSKAKINGYQQQYLVRTNPFDKSAGHVGVIRNGDIVEIVDYKMDYFGFKGSFQYLFERIPVIFYIHKKFVDPIFDNDGLFCGLTLEERQNLNWPF